MDAGKQILTKTFRWETRSRKKASAGFSGRSSVPSLRRAASLSAHDLEIIYPQFELNWPKRLGDVVAAGRVPRLGAMHVWRGDRDRPHRRGGESGFQGGRVTCQRSSRCQVGSEASWAAPAHALCSPAQLVSVIWGVCEGRRGGGPGCEGWGGGNAGCVDRKDECARVCGWGNWSGAGGVGGGVLRGIWFRGEGPFSTQHMPSLSQAGQLSRLILKEMVLKVGFRFIAFVSIFDEDNVFLCSSTLDPLFNVSSSTLLNI